MSEIDRSATLPPAVGAQVERGVRLLCSSCRFPLDEYAAGQRHYGTPTAHAQWYCIQRLCNEVDRLTAALKKANDQAEHFEREWYLRGDEIERLTPKPRGPMHSCDDPLCAVCGHPWAA